MRNPRARRLVPLSALPLGLALAGCPGGDSKQAQTERVQPTPASTTASDRPEAADDDGAAPDEKLPELDLGGPVPPQTSAVFFAVDGAMIPLGCFEQSSGKLRAGKECLALVEKGTPVLLGSEYGRALDTVGEPKNALCELAEAPTSLSTPALDGGQTYEWAGWPKALATKVEQVGSETRSDKAVAISEEERASLAQAVLAAKPGTDKGELRVNQKADLDIDGDGKKERFYSVLVAHPTSPDRSLYSALMMAPGGDMSALRIVESSTRDLDVLTIRGAVDLHGDGARELWVGLTFDGGSGDRIVVLEGQRATALGKWSCGA